MHQITKGRSVFIRKGIIAPFVMLVLVLSVSLGFPNALAGFVSPEGSPLVETKWLADNLNNAAIRIIHVGFIDENDKAKFDEKHIPGSVYLGVESLMGAMGDGSAPPDKAKYEVLMSQLGVSNDSHVVLYGDPAGNPFIPGVYWLMKYFGHAKASILNGVFTKWNTEGLKTTGESVEVKPATYKAGGPDETISADADYVLKNIKNDKVVLVDSRSPDEFVGKEDRNTRKGHIPGAVNLNFYPTNRNSDGTYKSVDDLKAAYEAQGVTKDKEVITYCEGAVRATDAYLVLKDILGYPNVRVYVGSWGEWGNRLDPEKYPLEK
jgi:thiosulfate/3-mercaptopyruvate sulfurtransferase